MTSPTPLDVGELDEVKRLAQDVIDALKVSAAEWSRRPQGRRYEEACAVVRRARSEFAGVCTPELLSRLVAQVERGPYRYDQAPDGCWVACIAGLTDIPHEEFTALIPYHEGQFDGSMGTEYRNAVNQLLRSRGWRLESLGPDVPLGFAVGSGTSPRGLFHAVLVKGGALWHDPHPSRDGISTLESYEVVIPIRPVHTAVEQFERWRTALAPAASSVQGADD